MAKVKYNVFTGNFDLVGEGEGDLPLNVKGDLLIHNGIALARFPVEADGKALVTDSTAGEGIAWKELKIPFITADGEIRGISLRQE
jgi:hypothetical protein